MVLVIHLMPLQEASLMVMRLMREIVAQEIRTAGHDFVQGTVEISLGNAKDCTPGLFVVFEFMQPLREKVAGDLIVFTDLLDGYSYSPALAIIQQDVENKRDSVLPVGNQPARQYCMRMEALRADHTLNAERIVLKKQTPATAVFHATAGIAAIQLTVTTVTLVTHELVDTKPMVQELIVEHLGSNLRGCDMAWKSLSYSGSYHRERQDKGPDLFVEASGRIDFEIAIEVVIGYHWSRLILGIFYFARVEGISGSFG